MSNSVRILITGASGFIGKNVVVRLSECENVELVQFTRSDRIEDLPLLLENVGHVIHLAGSNRPKDPSEFQSGNADLTKKLCEILEEKGGRISLTFASSIQADQDNEYGRSKLDAECHVREYAERTDAKVRIYRLANVFGKWCRPEYNSVVATFCYNKINGFPLRIDDPDRILRLVYVDDLVDAFKTDILDSNFAEQGLDGIVPENEISIRELVELLERFASNRSTLSIEKVGEGLVRALYATYISYLEPAKFHYDLTKHSDKRGDFVEFLRTEDSGQVSYFTARPGITRGGHYHHTKSEKFLVVQGKAEFRFRNILTNEVYSLEISGSENKVVETVPGWGHDITNVGSEMLLVILWANEVFDPDKPDTYSCDL